MHKSAYKRKAFFLYAYNIRNIQNWIQTVITSLDDGEQSNIELETMVGGKFISEFRI
jgi:hypothetical protein